MSWKPTNNDGVASETLTAEQVVNAVSTRDKLDEFKLSSRVGIPPTNAYTKHLSNNTCSKLYLQLLCRPLCEIHTCGIVDCPTRNVFSIVFNPRPGMGRCPIGGTIPGNCPGMKLGIGIMDEGRGGMPGIIPEGGPLRSGGSPIRGIRGIPPSGGGGKAITNEIHYLPAAKSP
jgi:hypothetical protein